MWHSSLPVCDGVDSDSESESDSLYDFVGSDFESENSDYEAEVKTENE